MRSYINASPTVEGDKYPCLMRLKEEYKIRDNINYTPAELIVLATAARTDTPYQFIGMVVHDEGKQRPLGEYYQNWDRKQFDVFKGEITLRG